MNESAGRTAEAGPVAFTAVFTLWSQAGGQGHLDMIPGRGKLELGIGAPWIAVKAAAAPAGRENPWNGNTLLGLAPAAASVWKPAASHPEARARL